MKKSILVTLICVLALTTVFVVLHYNRPNAGGQQNQPRQEEQVAAEAESILLTVDGYRNCSGQMSGVGTVGSYWSSTAEDRESAWRIGFEPDRIPHVTKISVTNHLRCYARSVRLVK